MNSKSKYDNPRYIANMEILGMLVDYLNNNPDQRFGQALVNLNIVKIKNGQVIDPFYTESLDTQKRVQMRLAELKHMGNECE